MISPLLTDLYQFTMGYGYWKLGMHNYEATFHLLFRTNPFRGNYALSCGLGSIVDFVNNWRFEADDIAYLATLKNAHHEPLFSKDYLDYLQSMRFSCDIDAVPEGTVVFPHEPMLRIQGPLLQCQLLESPLLNLLNFQTLVATKASRVCHAAQGDSVIEFGMRRAQGLDGALSASRAAYIGGCEGTSNTLAGKLFDIPVRGTHAHSWVTAFASELEAFEAYASTMPHNAILLVDTYNTIEGVKNAITIGKKLRAQGADLLGIRLDSGDMAQLSISARALLDEAGFTNTTILSSNALDEYVITDLKNRGAKISSWGVGTNLVTAYDQPALDGVYKLSSLRDNEGKWCYKLKLSEEEIKVSNPGRHQVRRFFCEGNYIADIIYDLDLGISDTPEAMLLNADMKNLRLDDVDAFVDLLQPIFRRGKLVQAPPSIHDLRKNAMRATSEFHQMHGEQSYSVGLEKNLYDLKLEMIKGLK